MTKAPGTDLKAMSICHGRPVMTKGLHFLSGNREEDGDAHGCKCDQVLGHRFPRFRVEALLHCDLGAELKVNHDVKGRLPFGSPGYSVNHYLVYVGDLAKHGSEVLGEMLIEGLFVEGHTEQY